MKDAHECILSPMLSLQRAEILTDDLWSYGCAIGDLRGFNAKGRSLSGHMFIASFSRILIIGL